MANLEKRIQRIEKACPACGKTMVCPSCQGGGPVVLKVVYEDSPYPQDAEKDQGGDHADAE